MRSPADGVWAAYGWDVGAYLVGVYPTEVEALRVAVSNCCHVVFLPWDTRIAEAVEATESVAAEPADHPSSSDEAPAPQADI